MIHTRICDLLGIDHPIILGDGYRNHPPLVAAVSNAGGFGTLGTSAFNAATLDAEVAAIRERTEKPFGINHLLFQIQEDMFAVTLSARPTVAAFAWARRDQNLRDYFQRAHEVGAKVMYMAGEVPEAVRAAGSSSGRPGGAGHRSRRSCGLDGVVAACADDGQSGGALAGSICGRHRRWPGPCGGAGTRSRRRVARHPLHGNTGKRRFIPTSSNRSSKATATIPF